MVDEPGRAGSRSGKTGKTGETAESAQADGPEDAAASDGDTAGLPPFVPSWRAFYILVIANLVLLILVFLGIQACFA